MISIPGYSQNTKDNSSSQGINESNQERLNDIEKKIDREISLLEGKILKLIESNTKISSKISNLSNSIISLENNIVSLGDIIEESKINLDSTKNKTLNNSQLIKSNNNEINSNISTLSDNANSIKSNIDSLGNIIEESRINLDSTKKKISSIQNETNKKFGNFNDEIVSKSSLIYGLIFTSTILALFLFFFLRRRVRSYNSNIENKIDSTIKSSREAHLKLDAKLLEILDAQIKFQENEKSRKSSNEIDHSLALKVADEITRMQNNIRNMPKETKGLKQLSRAVQRIKDTFRVNDYDMVEMIGKPYNEGMKAIANLTPDNTLKPGEQTITRVIKPQVNYKGTMIQSAQIEVNIGE